MAYGARFPTGWVVRRVRDSGRLHTTLALRR